MNKKWALFSLLLLLLLSACGGEEASPPPEAAPPPKMPEVMPEPPKAPEELEEEALQALLEGLTLEEKTGQLFFVKVPVENALEDVAAYHLGGYLLFGRDTRDRTANELIQPFASWQNQAV